MQNSITSLLNNTNMSCVYDNKKNPDPLFDDWLVQDALDDGDNDSMASSSPATTDDKKNANKGSPTSLSASSITTPPSPPVNKQPNTSTSGATHSSPALHGLAAALIALMNNKVPSPMMTQTSSAATTPPTTPPSSTVSTMSTKSSKATSSSTAGTKRKQPQRKPSSASSSSSSPSMDPVDEAAIKRQKNTDAARRSRLKKVLKMESLENKVTELEKVHSDLMMRVAVLDSEKAGLVSKETSYEERIKKLENQLAEAHKALAHKATSS